MIKQCCNQQPDFTTKSQLNLINLVVGRELGEGEVVVTELVVSGLVSTTTSKESGTDILDSDEIKVRSLDINGNTTEDVGTLSLGSKNSVTSKGRDGRTNPGDANDLVTLGGDVLLVVHTVNLVDTEDDLVSVELLTELVEVTLTSSNELKRATVVLTSEPEQKKKIGKTKRTTSELQFQKKIK